MTFMNKLGYAARQVETRLSDILCDSTARPGAPDRLANAMRHGALGGGKRFRPFLMIESAALFDVPGEDVLNAAAALECVHCYSLIHDDLPAMDDDDLRRGRPTVHVAFDEATAILAGDSLLTLAFEILARPDTHPEAGVRSELVLSLSRASGWQGMAGGQMLDLAAEGKSQSATEISRIHALKTAALIACACEMGAIVAEAGQDARASLRTFGQALGLAFQLTDDILDIEGDEQEVGKATGKDAEAGKATLVGMLGLEEAKRRIASLENEAIDALAPFGTASASLSDAARFVTRRNR